MKNIIADQFRKRFNSEPKLFFSPGRINFLGEHIDYNDGFVLPAAINKGVWFAVAENGTANDIHLVANDLDESFDTTLLNIHPVSGWQNYLLGVVAQFQKINAPLRGFDCVFGGDLPKGAGLSSSAALECGLAFALNEIFQTKLDKKTIALMGQKAEHEFPKVMCGIMDQFANMFGKENNIIFLDCNSLDYKYLPLSTATHSIVLVDSNVEHQLNSGEYNLRRQQCETGFAILQKELKNVKTFRDISPEQVKANQDKLEPVVYDRCLYVTEEIERTQKAVELLSNNNVEAFGKLMFQTHEGLSKLFGVSLPELDWLVEKAKAAGVTGARLMGGGFGGCTINLIEKEKAPQFAEQLVSDYEKQFGIKTQSYVVGPSEGTHQL
jgi:galactokinase